MKNIRFFYLVEKFDEESITDYLKKNVKIANLILAKDNLTKELKGYGVFRITEEDYVNFNPTGLEKSDVHDDWYIN